MSRGPLVIVGAGPTGLGAAARLEELGADWLLLERHGYPGGLSASFKNKGFVWDLGGHVIFSHYPRYDHFLEAVLPDDEWLWHRRAAFVRACGRWVPYPFQYNIWRLPARERWACLRGVVRLHTGKVVPERGDFQRFIDTHFGEGIARIFMNPYNRKVWGYSPKSLSADWMAERVAGVDLERLLDHVIHRREDVSWGLNDTFRFPRRGGTGRIWQAAAQRLPVRRLRFNVEVVRVSSRQRTLVLAGGQELRYAALINTMPLDRLVKMSDLARLREPAAGLWHSSLHVVGLGLAGAPPKTIAKHCWMYFPEDRCPFYRATLFSNYSPHHVPRGCWSLLLETSESPEKPVDGERIVKESLRGCRAAGLLGRRQQVVAAWHRRVEYAYPTPTKDRDGRLAALLPALERQGIFSRGRFGAWKYEVGNMDHSYMQGVEVAERLVLGREETVVHWLTGAPTPVYHALMSEEGAKP